MYPFLEPALSGIGISAGVPNEIKLDKLDEWIRAADQDPIELAPIFGSFLNIDATVRYPPTELTPQQQKAKLFEAFSQRLLRIADNQGLVFVVEDAHWIDPSTLDLLDMHIEQARELPNVMIIVTYRPEFDAPWVGQPHATLLALNRLSRRECATLVTNVTGMNKLPADMIDQIAERTDGVPLFVEELTQAILEGSKEEPIGSSLDVPATLQDSLEARLDRLGPAKEVAQIGAVIGRTFDYDLLSRVSDVDSSVLQPALETLVGSGLVTARGEIPNATYTFKHALVRETAYGSLLRSRRAELHSAIGATLEKHFPETVASQPDLLAHHFAEAGVVRKAVDYWLEAGRAAMKRWAMPEAIANFEVGLVLIERLDDANERASIEIDYQLDLGVAYRYGRGSGQKEVGSAYKRAYELCMTIGETDRAFRALHRSAHFNWTQGTLAQSINECKELLSNAEASGNAKGRIVANSLMGMVHWLAGENTAALQNLKIAYGVIGPEFDRESARRLDIDGILGTANCYQGLAFAHLSLGNLDQASAHANKTVEIFRGHPNAISQPAWMSLVMILLGDAKKAREWADYAFDAAQEQQIPHWSAFAKGSQGRLMVDAGRPDDAISQISDAMSDWREAGWGTFRPVFQAHLIDAYLACSKPEEALEITNLALETITENGEKQFESLLHACQGDACLALPAHRLSPITRDWEAT